MERTDSHRDRSQSTRTESPPRDGVEIIITFGPPASAAAREASRAVAVRDGVDTGEAWVRVAHDVFESMNEAGPQVESELDAIVSRALRTPVFVFGAVPNTCYEGGGVYPTLHLDVARIVDHYGNPVARGRFGERAVKAIMAGIADALEAEWARAVVVRTNEGDVEGQESMSGDARGGDSPPAEKGTPVVGLLLLDGLPPDEEIPSSPKYVLPESERLSEDLVDLIMEYAAWNCSGPTIRFEAADSETDDDGELAPFEWGFRSCSARRMSRVVFFVLHENLTGLFHRDRALCWDKVEGLYPYDTARLILEEGPLSIDEIRNLDDERLKTYLWGCACTFVHFGHEAALAARKDLREEFLQLFRPDAIDSAS